MKKEKKKKTSIPWLQLLAGALLGVFFAEIIFTTTRSLEWFIVGFASFIISFYLHMILHEGGHLLAGLASGYQFVSFRIGSVMWIKIQGKICRKKLSIPGTGGQCLLDPPEPTGGQYPAVFYNLGGGLANLLLAAIASVSAFAMGTVASKVILLPFALIGIYLALMNLLPLKIGGIANDGYNIKTFRKDADSARAFWIQMKINKQQSDGGRLRDVSEEYFDLADSEEKGNPLIDAIKVFRFQRQIDEKDFAGARESGEKLLAEKDLLSVYRNLIKSDLLYLELIGPCRTEVVERLYTPEFEKYLKLVKSYPSAQRLHYAYAVRYAHDEAAAASAREKFEKVLKDYPMLGEIQLERELMEEI